MCFYSSHSTADSPPRFQADTAGLGQSSRGRCPPLTFAPFEPAFTSLLSRFLPLKQATTDEKEKEAEEKGQGQKKKSSSSDIAG